MPDEATSSGLWSAVIAAIGTVGGIGVAFIRRPSSDGSAARAVSLDRTQQGIIDRLLQELREAKEDARLWERRARRADQWAHDMRHAYVNAIPSPGAGGKVPCVPLLEDPL